MNKIIKGFWNRFKKVLYIKDVPGNYNEYDFVLNTSFIEPGLITSIYRDVVILTINNNFYVDPALLLAHFKHNYDFTINEFIILSFKVGSITKLYLENPTKLLEDAIELTDDFSPKNIKQLKVLLRDQKALEDENFQDKHKNYLIKVEDDKRKAKLRVKGIENDKANAQIDAWLRNNKRD